MADRPAERESWVELLRVHDRFDAEITIDLLEDHEVPVRTYGGATSALPTIGLTDVRILVRSEDHERAGQLLEAMRGGRSDAHPFRDAPPEPYEAPVRRHHAPQIAWVLGIAVVAYVMAALLGR
jgi:hypothetical protein